MPLNEAAAAIHQSRLASTDLQEVEIKSGASGPPKSLAQTVSALSNSDGGLIILGVEERQGFKPVPIDTRRIADALATACSQQVEPAIRAEITVVEFEGSPVVVAAVPALERARKPCFVKTQGLERGSYIRSHDGDRHLTTYEIHALISDRGQPKEDIAPVEGSSADDLVGHEVDAYLSRLRATRGAVFAELDTPQVLRMTGVLTPDGSGVTLAGLMALARYPQQYLPQLNVTFVAFPTTDARPMTDGTRFLDNIPLDGPIPKMVDGVWTALSHNITRRAVVSHLGREDIWEYPPRAVRELIVNALMHRDYHRLAQGSQVRVELYPDRLSITSPGGLYGPVNTEMLQHSPITSTRNLFLARLLEDVIMPHSQHTVAENRGTGLLVVAAELERAGHPPLEIRTDLLSFTATIRRQEPQQPSHKQVHSSTPTPRQREVLGLLEAGPKSAEELASALGVTRAGVTHHLRALEAAGAVKPTTQSRHAPNVQWRVTQ